jgi:hypothetical protein
MVSVGLQHMDTNYPFADEQFFGHLFKTQLTTGWRHSSVVEDFASMYEALDSILNTEKENKNQLTWIHTGILDFL